MSVPAFAWAIEKGMELGLSPSLRLLLIYMADQADGNGVFHTGQPRLAKGTGLTERTIRTLIPQLAELRLISVDAKPGKGTVYRLLRQPNGADTPEVASAPEALTAPEMVAVHTTPTPEVASAPEVADPGNLRHRPRKLTAATPETISANPLRVPKEDTQGGVVVSVGDSVPRARGHKHTLPPSWKPNPSNVACGLDCGLSPPEVEAEAERMRDWAAAGAETRADWHAFFRNWLRDAGRRKRERPDRRTIDDLRREWDLPTFLAPTPESLQ